MTKTDDTHVTWRTTSHTGETCVEVWPGAVVRVRDTKDRDRGEFRVSAQAWTAFVTGVC